MTVTRNINGSITLSIIQGGYRIAKTYYGYTLAEAKALFREYVKTI